MIRLNRLKWMEHWAKQGEVQMFRGIEELRAWMYRHDLIEWTEEGYQGQRFRLTAKAKLLMVEQRRQYESRGIGVDPLYPRWI